MTKKNLLLCFDAFGTLFKPKRPIAQQYGEVARSLGLGGFSDVELQASFKKAFKQESACNPNYGKSNGMNAEKWWTNIIHNTFEPLIGQGTKIHGELAPRLLYRFASEEGYTIFPDVVPLMKQLPKDPQSEHGRTIVGVVTNSDDRVPEVLTSLGLRIGPLRYGGEFVSKATSGELYDVDFTVMSYDVGYEKPDKRIFNAAEDMLKESLAESAGSADPGAWQKVYVGDEYDKDVVGAVNAGWNAVLIDREKSEKREHVTWLDGREPSDLEAAFHDSQAIGFSSLAALGPWLPKGP